MAQTQLKKVNWLHSWFVPIGFAGRLPTFVTVQRRVCDGLNRKAYSPPKKRSGAEGGKRNRHLQAKPSQTQRAGWPLEGLMMSPQQDNVLNFRKPETAGEDEGGADS